MTITELIILLEEQFKEARNPDRAKKMSSYMKDLYSYYGITAPNRQEIQKKWFATIKKHDYNFWDLIRALYHKHEREYQMVAVDLLKKRPLKDYKQNDWKPLEYVIITKSWWDSVDLIASNYVGKYFTKFPEQRNKVIQKWSDGTNIWLHRTCLLFQLKYKDKLDFDFLTESIDRFKANPEFFIQKAIGWSLRQHSKYDQEEVKEYLAGSGLEGLAKREAERLMRIIDR